MNTVPGFEFEMKLGVFNVNWDLNENFTCELLLDDMLMRRFEGCGSVQWVGSGKSKPKWSVLPRDRSYVRAKFYLPGKEKHPPQLLAVGEVETWALISEDTAVTVPLNFADANGGPSPAGQLQIRFYPIRTWSDELVDVERNHTSPTLTNLCKALKALQYDGLPHNPARNVARLHLEALYAYVQKNYNMLVFQAKKRGARDNHGRPVDPMNLRGNPLEDMLIQIRTQLDFVQVCMRNTSLDLASQAQRDDILSHILDAAARAALIICTSAHIYFECNYPTISVQPGQDLETIYYWHKQFLLHRTQLVFLLNSRSDAPPEYIYDLLALLLREALNEARDGDDWMLKSFTMILACAREYLAQLVFDMIKEELRLASKADVQHRDALRRVLVHICQQADLLPQYLVLTSDNVDLGEKSSSMSEGDNKATGEGSYATVYEGRMNVKGQLERSRVAIKRLKFMTGDDEDERIKRKQEIHLEIVNTWTLQHDRIIALLGITHTFGSISLVIPYMKNKTVTVCLNQLKKQANLQIPIVKTCNEWIINVSEGLAYLHREGVIHGDLRGSNILVDDGYKAVIADFGLSIFAQGHSKNYASRRTGNSGWAAPELLDNPAGLSGRPTLKSDIYAFGIVCVEIYTGRVPYANDDGSVAFCRRITVERERPPRPEEPVPHNDTERRKVMCDGLWKLVGECWEHEAHVRPSATEVHRRLLEIGV